MEIKVCRSCGSIYNYIAGENICPKCKEKIEEKFAEVKKYLYSHKGATVVEVADECNVSEKQIKKWIREERLEFSEGVSTVTCEKCGKAIPTGRFCAECKNAMANTLNAIANPIKKTEIKENKTGPKMRFM